MRREGGHHGRPAGPKIRVGKFENGKITLANGDKFILDAECQLGNQERVGLDYKDCRATWGGDVLLLNDGLIVLKVDACSAKIHTVVKIGGELSNNKGINRQGGGLTAPALTAKDMDDIKTAMSFRPITSPSPSRRTPPTWKWRASWPTWPASPTATSR
jgi:pyruvate kinase